MKRRWKLLAVAAVPGVYWIDQCALPSVGLVDVRPVTGGEHAL